MLIFDKIKDNNVRLWYIDETVKTDKDENSIGLILCRDKDRLTVEYALKESLDR